MVNTLLFVKILYIRRICRARDWARILVFLAFVFLAVGVAVGAYIGFLRGFRFFAHDAYFGDALTAYTMEAVFFITIFLVFASAVASGIWTLFNSPENQFLLATPISRYKLFASRFLKNAFASAWPLVLLGVPAIAAFARVASPPILALALFTTTLLLLFFSTVALATYLDFVLVKFFRAIRGISFVLLVGVLIILGIAWVGGKLLPVNLSQLFYAEQFEKSVAPANLILAHFQGTLGHPAVQYLFARPYAPWPFMQWILAAAANLCILGLLARYFYLPLLSRSSEGVFIARPEDKTRSRAGFKKFPMVLGGSFGALLEKDVLVFFRSRREVSRALFLLLMLFLYLFLFQRLRRHSAELSPEVFNRIVLFDFAVIGYFVTTLSLRFIFPLISLEGKSAWATFISPIRRSRVFWEKLVLGIVPLALCVALLAVVSAKLLGLHGFGIVIFLRPVAVMSIIISLLALSIGTIWPNFRENDPDKLSTTMPGLLATALSLGYVAWASYAGSLSVRAYLDSGAILPSILIPIALFNTAAIVVLLYAALRRIKTLDIST